MTTDMIPAWKVEIYWYSSIVGHLAGWNRTTNPEEEKVFRTEEAAREYAERKTGIASILVPYMSRKGVVVPTLRPRDWRERVAAALSHLRPRRATT